MDCHNCGAPLDWDGSRPIIVCEFCSSIRSVDATSGSADRVSPLDHPGGFDCPRCRQSLVVAAMDGLKVEHCQGCRGVIIQRHLFATLVRNRRADFRGADARPIPLDFDQLKLIVDCPSCKQAMEVHPYYGPGNIVIDSCSHCGLVWLDSGEMSRIEVAPGRR
ncbi:MAG TPA: zf-TFIIB domain-containing protein [Schlesneria sp.]|jgi:Zn-finger nucleic acid-binding protein